MSLVADAMKYIFILSLVFIAGCGTTKPLMFNEYKAANKERVQVIAALCEDEPNPAACREREEKNSYRQYLSEPSRFQRYIKSRTGQPTYGVGGSNGTTVYSADECIGSIVNGKCHGTILPKQSVHKKCYGQMLNGQCTGPMF